MKKINLGEIRGKRVLVRIDLNEPPCGKSNFKIQAITPTIKSLLENNNKVILISHFGQPNDVDRAFSLEVFLSEFIHVLPDINFTFVHDFMNPSFSIDPDSGGNLWLLENLRFWEGEKNSDAEFAKKLASFADIYINEAFSASHRDNASITILPKLLPSGAGPRFVAEVENLSQLINNPIPPTALVLGGAKKDKLELLDLLTKRFDHILLGGKLASMYLADRTKISDDNRIILPVDAITTTTTAPQEMTSITDFESVVDIGPKTVAQFEAIISQSSTIAWNGPMGKSSHGNPTEGTKKILDSILSNRMAYSVVGGGETIDSLNDSEISRFSWASTGGGAMLDFIAKGTLVGIEALK